MRGFAFERLYYESNKHPHQPYMGANLQADSIHRAQAPFNGVHHVFQSQHQSEDGVPYFVPHLRWRLSFWEKDSRLKDFTMSPIQDTPLPYAAITYQERDICRARSAVIAAPIDPRMMFGLLASDSIRFHWDNQGIRV